MCSAPKTALSTLCTEMSTQQRVKFRVWLQSAVRLSWVRKLFVKIFLIHHNLFQTEKLPIFDSTIVVVANMPILARDASCHALRFNNDDLLSLTSLQQYFLWCKK